MSEMDIEQIKAYLPHRYPFLLVDRVTAVDPGKTIDGLKNVSINEPFFTGHFPAKPVMPGVLILEALAQLSGILIFKTLDTMPGDVLFYLAGVDEARFKRVVLPGDQLHLHVELQKSRRGLWKFYCQATVEGELACEATIMNIEGKSDDRQN